ncbi:hypothetical protein [Nocardia sp. NPDC050718]|uniref:hypothetical protein n=1 Tax=Nocardia sp. NPDC050718 TaxID=3155788 RepID=UPI0033CDC19A
MKILERRRILIAAVAVVVVAAAATILQLRHHTPPSRTEDPAAAMYGGTMSTCFWKYGAVGAVPDTVNVAYPDAGAVYWTAAFRRPPGSTLTLSGTFPHARYTSLISYDISGRVIDGLADYQYEPDAGSVNPFRPGAPRGGTNHYTVTVAEQQNLDPDTRRPRFSRNPKYGEAPRNTLYAEPDTPNTETVGGRDYAIESVTLRTYVPDRGTDLNGDVPLPEPQLTLADGTRLTGQGLCDAIDSESKDRLAHGLEPRGAAADALRLDDSTFAALRHPETLTQPCNVLTPTGCPTDYTVPPALVQNPRPVADPATFPATPEANWRAQYDRRYLLQLYTGDDAPGASMNPQRAGGGGFFPNMHNNYVRNALNHRLGDVVVLRGKLPTSPRTEGGETTFPADAFQTRYTSFCMTESIQTTRTMNCVFDEQIATDPDGYYTIVISRAGDRPANADPGCGRTWLEWQTPRDTDPDFAFIQIRNMLPDQSFAQATQNTRHPGDEKAVMGDYLPTVTYMSKAQSEATGCPVGREGQE